MLPQEILGVLRHTEKHTELLDKIHIISSSLAKLLEHWKPSPLARAYTVCLLSRPIPRSLGQRTHNCISIIHAKCVSNAITFHIKINK